MERKIDSKKITRTELRKFSLEELVAVGRDSGHPVLSEICSRLAPKDEPKAVDPESEYRFLMMGKVMNPIPKGRGL